MLRAAPMQAHGKLARATERPLSFTDRLLAWRDALLANPRFQRWAAGFPLTRRTARREAQALFDLCAGFVYSQVLAACVELRLFDILADGPATPAQLAPRLALSPDATERLLVAAASLRLLQARTGGAYGLGMLGAALRANPAILDMVRHHGMLYADLRDPVELLRGERPHSTLNGYWSYAAASNPSALSTADVEGYTALMSASQAMIAAEVLDAYPPHRHRCILDVGGGDGAFLAAVAPRAPDLTLQLFDLPPVAERARERFGAAGLSARATAFGGDVFADTLPGGADLLTLVRVLHDHDDAAALAILKAAYAALAPGGTLLIAEPMSGASGRTADVYFGFYLMAMGQGRARAPWQISDLARAAGFGGLRQIRTRQPMLTQVLTGKR